VSREKSREKSGEEGEQIGAAEEGAGRVTARSEMSSDEVVNESWWRVELAFLKCIYI
jgi:hypothetical protein